MTFINQDRRSLFLLVSVLLFFVLTPFLQENEIGESCLVVSIYLTLVAATLELSAKPILFWTAIPLAGISMTLVLASHLHRTQTLLIANHVVLTVFFGFVSVALFHYLGRKGQITSGRLYVSVSLYFLLALDWFSLYTLISAFQPGSFAEAGVVLAGNVQPSKLLYFSLATLTTLGYGDIVAIRPGARMFATMEAAAGVLYIAITVARLVASYQIADRK